LVEYARGGGRTAFAGRAFARIFGWGGVCGEA
jgi:hypothetical protein